jgi:hypothetical protein
MAVASERMRKELGGTGDKPAAAQDKKLSFPL